MTNFGLLRRTLLGVGADLLSRPGAVRANGATAEPSVKGGRTVAVVNRALSALGKTNAWACSALTRLDRMWQHASQAVGLPSARNALMMCNESGVWRRSELPIP